MRDFIMALQQRRKTTQKIKESKESFIYFK